MMSVVTKHRRKRAQRSQSAEQKERKKSETDLTVEEKKDK